MESARKLFLANWSRSELRSFIYSKDILSSMETLSPPRLLACQLTCTDLIKNVISRYCFNCSSVFECFLEASKAFDRVSHLKLFSKLLEKNLPTIIRLLFSWFWGSKILWNKTLSENLVSNGVGQGGVLSPILFISLSKIY